ncbi:MAG: DUF6265 family protein, partial [Thermoanaerobaculia bacterium]|nr:DUF6265 family protein [Thermoanaerobaculia bacterium]
SAFGEGPKADITSLSWLAGAWGGDDAGMRNEELWIPPKAGSMLAVHRDVKNGKTVGFEFLRIEQRGDSLVYLASPGGKPATPFPLAAIDATSVVFESALEFPRRVSYRKNPDGTLSARIEGMRNGKPAAKEWIWKRVAKD